MNRFIILAACAALSLSACKPDAAAQTKTSQSQKAAEAANSISFTENAEIENIKARLELTSKPGILGFITLMNAAGQPIAYYSVKGKITSGGKRLTKPVKLHHVDRGEFNGTALGPAPSDEGTWGSSSPYVYFWTTDGRYIQWSGDYLYSDQPYRLNVEPLVVALKAPAEAATK